MFLGHFGLALAAKPLAPRLSLGTAIMSTQFLDLLWPTFLLLGFETVRIAPGATAVTPLVFEHYPLSHSLAAAIAWGVALGAACGFLRASRRQAFIAGALVASHWVLDALVHVPDLPLVPGSDKFVGLGLWNSPASTLALEFFLLAAGVWLYARCTRPADKIGRFALIGLVGFLTAIQLGNLFGPPPPDVAAIAWVGQAQWLLVAWGYWIDAHRKVVGKR